MPTPHHHQDEHILALSSLTCFTPALHPSSPPPRKPLLFPGAQPLFSENANKLERMDHIIHEVLHSRFPGCTRGCTSSRQAVASPNQTTTEGRERQQGQARTLYQEDV